MNKKKSQTKNFQTYIKSLLNDPNFRKRYREYSEQLEISYRILKRKRRKKNSQRWAEQ
jgi:hypothetical protein